MMDVLYCVLNDSPEALNMMQEEHIRVIISLLEKFGRDPKVSHSLYQDTIDSQDVSLQKIFLDQSYFINWTNNQNKSSLSLKHFLQLPNFFLKCLW